MGEVNITNLKELQNYLTERIKSVDRCYEELVKPYKTEYGLNISLMT